MTTVAEPAVEDVISVYRGDGLLELLMASVRTTQSTLSIQTDLLDRLTARVEALETAQRDGSAAGRSMEA